MESMVKEKVLKCAIDLGLLLPEHVENIEKDIELSIEDSMEFITFVVELEQIFSIEISDVYLSIECFKSIDSIVRIISESMRNENA